jgi:hypothetical protein
VRSPIAAQVLLAASLFQAGTTFAAEPTATDKETARALMDDGDHDVEVRDYAAALKAYRAAYALVPVPTTGIEVARTEAALGQLVLARDTAMQVARMPRASKEPRVFGEARAAAEDLAEKLRARIPAILVAVKGPPAGTEVHVTVDGMALPRESTGEPRKVDPGKHRVAVSADGYSATQQDVDVPEQATQTVAFALTPLPGAASTARPAGAVPPAERSGERHLSPLVLPGLVVTGVGVAAGSITGALSWSSASSARRYCQGTVCSLAAQSDIDWSKTLAWIADAAFGVAAVGAVLTVTGFLAPGGSNASATPTNVGVAPVLGPRMVGVAGRF